MAVSHPLLSGRDQAVKTSNQRQLIKKMKAEWKSLWRERINDRTRAEGIANKNYAVLFVERGTVVHATRNFKPPNFREILKRHKHVGVSKIPPPSHHEGGWGKFIRSAITSRFNPSQKGKTLLLNKKLSRQHQLKKKDKGWVHFRV